MRISLRTWAAIAVAAVIVGGTPAQAVVPLFGVSGVGARAFAGQESFGGDQLGVSGLPTIIAFDVDVTATTSDSPASARATSSVRAVWADAASGTVEYSGSWDLDGGGTVVGFEIGPIGGPPWSYEFRAEGDGLFSMSYDIRSLGDLAVNGEWAIGYNEFDATGNFLSAGLQSLGLPVSSTGTFELPLIAGYTYYVDFPGTVFSGIARERVAGSTSGVFSWKIAEIPVHNVPEPATWVMMVSGFGLVGATLRRRGRLAAPA